MLKIAFKLAVISLAAYGAAELYLKVQAEKSATSVSE